MKIDGQCHCGAIHFEAEIDPERVVICHCSDCQTISGAPYRVNAPAPRAGFQLSGEVTQYEKIGSSGARIVTAFCGVCGAGIFSHRAENAQYVNIRVGSIRQRATLTPKAQGFCDSAMPWAWDISTVGRIPR
jgi:hypothetical protein